MKKLLFGLSFFTVLLLTSGVAVAAENLIDPPGPGTITIIGPGGVLDRITNVMFVVAMAVAVIFFIIAGYLFIMAQGEPEKFETAKKTVLYTGIGVIIVLCAKGLVSFLNMVVTGRYL